MTNRDVEINAIANRVSRQARTGPVSFEEAAERRARVMQAAGLEFMTHGFQRANIDRIAKRSQVSKRTIYADYGDKNDLFKEFFVTNIKNFQSTFERSLSSNPPVEEVIRSVVRFAAGHFDAQNLALVRLAVAERDRFPELADLVLKQSYELVSPLSQYLLKHANFELTRDESERRVFHLMHMALGGAAALLSDPLTFYGDIDVWVDSVVSTFLHGFPMKG